MRTWIYQQFVSLAGSAALCQQSILYASLDGHQNPERMRKHLVEARKDAEKTIAYIDGLLTEKSDQQEDAA